LLPLQKQGSLLLIPCRVPSQQPSWATVSCPAPQCSPWRDNGLKVELTRTTWLASSAHCNGSKASSFVQSRRAPARHCPQAADRAP
ncbi:hypothetical protein EDB85DRAFT_2271155, partial [Lactarius pseudohatsudake]